MKFLASILLFSAISTTVHGKPRAKAQGGFFGYNIGFNDVPNLLTSMYDRTNEIPTGRQSKWHEKEEKFVSIEENFNFVKRVQAFNYSAEEYIIVNKDGYNLRLHRISGGPTRPPARGKKVVYLQHGLGMWTYNYILRGPGKDLVFLLVDAGYDVWMGNARGNAYSRTNNKISPKNESFWDFSYHEVALYDVSLFIDEALRISGQKKLIYIGFSLGTTESFVLFSSRPEYNQKVSLIIEFAPVAFWKHNKKSAFIWAVSSTAVMQQTMNSYLFGFNEILALESSESSECTYWCKKLAHIVKPVLDSRRFEKSTIEMFDKTFPAGTSAKTIFHLASNMNEGKFAPFEYKEDDFKIYGSTLPKEYPLGNIKAPVVLFHGSDDIFTTDEDVEDLASRLPNVQVRKIKHPSWTHSDFLWAKDSKELLYDDVLNLIAKYVDK